MLPKLAVYILSAFFAASSASALTKSAEFLVLMETKANAIALRSDEPVRVPHYEIPIEMLEVNFAERLDPEIKKQLVFEKKGRTFVRWILNPEDTQWFSEVAKYFQNKGLNLRKKYYFIGYQTASRSYIIEDPAQKVQFSFKASTNRTGGSWKNKKQGAADAEDSRLNADYLFEIQKRLRFKHLVLMDEPAVMKINDIDQGVVIRDLGALSEQSSRRFYIPGFSVLHNETGKAVAQKNGSSDPYEFWTEHYIRATGRALGELAARTGVQIDSPHSQNFLVELDDKLRPTGRIVIRDLADLVLDKNYIDVLHPNPAAFYSKYSEPKNLIDSISVGFGPLHGNYPPQWVNGEKYMRWGDAFLSAFDSTFSEITGLKAGVFMRGRGRIHGKYFENTYRVNWESMLANEFVKNLIETKSPRGILNCSFILI